MSKARFPQAKVFDTTGIAGTSASPIDGSGAYTTYEVPLSPSVNTPVGVTSTSRNKLRHNQKAQVNTTDTLANRDEFDLSRAEDLS